MTTPLDSNPKLLFAQFGVRVGAVGFDLSILMFLAQVAHDHLLPAIGLTIEDHRWIVLVVASMYFGFSWLSPMRATPVQFLFGMRVVDESGEKLSLGRAALRSLMLTGLIVATLAFLESLSNPYLGMVALVGYVLVFLAAVTPNRQAGHDLLARSLVVNKIALKSPEYRGQLCEHVSGRDSVSRGRRRPSALSIVGNMFVLAVPVFVLVTFAQVENDRDLRARVGYAIRETAPLKMAVQEYYLVYERWPAKEVQLGAATRSEYPDGGYYELEDDGVIRIRFTVKPDLMNGSIVLSPLVKGGAVTWGCHSDGDLHLSGNLLPSVCRD